MDVKEARSLIYELLGVFYSKASVKHSKQPNTVKSKPPLVTLTTISVKRPLNPPQKVIDGIMVSYYPTRMALQIDLCTKGAPVEQRPGFIVPAENTALSDLLEFANFVASDYAVNWCHQHDVSIVLTGEAHDTSELINDASYQFRATMELAMNFTQKAVGYTAMLDPSSIKHSSAPGETPGGPGSPGTPGTPSTPDTPVIPDTDPDEAEDVYIEPVFVPSASGGANEELAKETLGYFTSAEITNKEEK